MALIWHWPLYAGLLLAWVASAAYAYGRKFSLVEILAASWQGMRRMGTVCAVLLLIGCIVALWMESRAIPYLTDLGAAHIQAGNLLWVAFLLAALLSLIIGSSIATWSVLGPPLMGLAGPAVAPILAGALVSGGMVGDRASPMSSALVLMSSVTDVPQHAALRQLIRTLLVPAGLTALLFWLVNRTVMPQESLVHASLPSHSGTWHSLMLPGLLVAMAVLRVPLLYNLACALVVGLLYCRFAAHIPLPTILSGAWHGVAMPWAHGSKPVGGLLPMLSAVMLILSAGAFQGVTVLGESIQTLTRHALSRIQNRLVFGAAAYALCTTFTLFMGSQMLSIVMSENTLQEPFRSRSLPREALLQVIADTAELFPAVIPWNLLGLQSAVIFNVPTHVMAPFAWYIYLTIAWSFLWFNLRWNFPSEKNERALCTHS
jgi:NhaC family Na+:H+ antiporter